VVADRCVVFSSLSLSPKPTQLGRITGANELSRSGFGLSAKVTRMGVEGVDLSDSGYRKRVRDTAIYIETGRERLLLNDADVPMPPELTDRLVVQGTADLPIGRRIVLAGEQWTSTPGKGPIVGEVATLKSSAAVTGGTELVFDRPIATTFRSTTLRLLANCVGASHGETPVTGAEVIGSASTARLSPSFPLKRTPLTYVPAPADARGYVPAIEVRVGERAYEERPSLFGMTSEDRAFSVTSTRGNTSDVQFAGRLPSGTFNVSALYRTGGGKGGNLAVGRLSTVMTPILGVRAVSNPVPADGASDPESIDDLRTAAPQSVRALDRVVSLADHESFARTRPGIGKALATELRVGMRSAVCLTIATTDMTSPVAGSDVVESLRTSLAHVSVPGRTVRIEGFTDLRAKIGAALARDPAFRRADVEVAVRQRLGAAFGRELRAFGAPLYRSAVIAEIQRVEGVVAASLTTFEVPGGPAEDDGRLSCPLPSMVDGTFVRGGLLSIDPDDVEFTEMLP
jgi:predicted phage baseplate assembly protein